MTCVRCSGPLYGCDRAVGAEVCVECVRESLAPSEWQVFVRALRAATDEHGRISQTRVRPRIQSIPPKHRGQLYRRAMAEGLIRPEGYEPSTDVRGRNTDKPQRTYRWADAAANAA